MSVLRALTWSLVLFGGFTPVMRAAFAVGDIAVSTGSNPLSCVCGTTWVFPATGSPLPVSDPGVYRPDAVAFDARARLFMSRQVEFTLGTAIYETPSSPIATLPFTAIQLLFMPGENLLAL